MKKTFHHAGKNSPRIMRLIKALRFAPAGLTTFVLGQDCGSTRPSSDVSEAVALGYDIRCKYEGFRNGRKIYRYTLHT